MKWQWNISTNNANQWVKKREKQMKTRYRAQLKKRYYTKKIKEEKWKKGDAQRKLKDKSFWLAYRIECETMKTIEKRRISTNGKQCKVILLLGYIQFFTFTHNNKNLFIN